MKLWIVLVLFLLVGAFFIISNENLHLSNEAEAYKFGKIYYSWFGNLLANGQSLVGYLVRSDWLPSNSK